MAASITVDAEAFATRVKQDLRILHSAITGLAAAGVAGYSTATIDMTGLSTTAQNIIGAINEIATTAGNAAVINDATPSLTTAYSGQKIEDRIGEVIASAPAALDTLNEIATALNNDPNLATTLNGLISANAAAIALKANIADTYTRTEIGDISALNLVGTYDAA